ETRIPAPGSYEFPALQKKLVIKEIGAGPPGARDFPADGQYLDGDLFSFPLTLRGPLAGDRFHPLGAPGRRKVFDFLTDQKINRQQRKQVPVLCADNSILALPGLRIDHRFRITETTTRVVRLNWEDMSAA
ncbi:MAG: tRNA lysidine(34) synthetase TilS, partial [Desulfobulbales bacterium]